MGDISEMRGLITVGCFIGSFIILAAFIPNQFFIFDNETRTIETPEYFDALDIQSYYEHWGYEMNWTGGIDRGSYYDVDVDLGGHDFNFEYTPANSSLYARMRHWYANWIFPTQHTMEWINRKGVKQSESVGGSWRIYASAIEEDYEDSHMPYRVQCDHFSIDVYFGYNETLYSSVSDAWNHDSLHVFVGINFDQASTSWNAWSLLGKLLFFQLPDIHWIINGLIAIPIWLCIAYLSFIFILRAIGAVFGGGGA